MTTDATGTAMFKVTFAGVLSAGEVIMATSGRWALQHVDALRRPGNGAGRRWLPVAQYRGRGAFTVRVQNLDGSTASVTHGVAFSLTLTVEDAYGNVVTGYVGTVYFTSLGSTAIVPANYIFTAGDTGVHTFVNKTTLKKKGMQTIAVTDTLNSGLAAADSISVA